MAVENYTVLSNGLRLGSSVAVNQILNESDLSSNSAEAIPTQASVKTYVDSLEVSPTPAGSSGQLQWNNASVTAGTDELHWDDTNDTLILGESTTTSSVTGNQYWPLQVFKSTLAGVAIGTATSNDTNGPNIQFNRARGSMDSPSTVTTNNTIGNIRFKGVYGSVWSSSKDCARIDVTATEGYTSTTSGASLELKTCNTGADDLETRYAIDGASDHVWYGAGASPSQLMRIDAGNSTVLVGDRTERAIGSSTFIMQIAKDASVGLGVSAASTVAGAKAYAYLLRTRGSHDSAAALQSGDSIGGLYFAGTYNATPSRANGARVEATTTELWSATQRGTKLELDTVTNGTTSLETRYVINGDGSQSWYGAGASPTVKMHMTSLGRFGVGTDSPSYGITASGDDYIGASISAIRYAGSGSSGPGLRFYGARGDETTPTARQSDDGLGSVYFGGYDGDSFEIGPYITSTATETWSNSGRGGELKFYVMNAGSTTQSLAMTLADDANVGIGTDSPSYNLHIEAEGASSIATLGMRHYNTTPTNAPQLRLGKSNNTQVSPDAINSGDTLGYIKFEGYGATSWHTGAQVRVIASQDWTDSVQGCGFEFDTTATGSSALSTNMVLTEAGYLGVKIDDPVYGIHVSADDDRAGGSIMMQNFTGTGGGGPILAFRSARGSEATPSEPDSGHNLAYIAATGYDGSTYKSGGIISCVAEQDWSSTALGSAWYFYVCENNTTSADWKMRIRQDGSVWMPDVYGDSHTSGFRDLVIKSDGQLGYDGSSATKYKENIQDLTDASWIFDLQAKAFTFKSEAPEFPEDPAAPTHYGFLAEDLEALNDAYVFYEGSEVEGIYYKKLVVPAICALQQVKVEADGYGDRLDTLDARYAPTAGGGHAWYDTAETPAKVLEVTDAGSLYAYQTYNDTVVNGRDLMIQSDGKIGYESSAKRYKKYIKGMGSARWLNDLRPVTFKNRKDGTNEQQYGLIAEEVEEVNRDFVFYDDEYKIEGVHYKKFIPVLIKAQQEQREEAQSLEETVADLEQKIMDLQEKLSKLSDKGKTRPKF